MGPSIGRQAVTKLAQWVAANPGKAAIGYQAARAAGIPLPDVLGWLFKYGGTD
jgi:hypothetical protein